MSEPTSDVPARRPSKSGDASYDAELARIRRMSIEERMLEALRLHAALAALKPAPGPSNER